MNRIFRRPRSRSPAPTKSRLPRQKAVDVVTQESVDIVRLGVPSNPRIRSSSFDSSSLQEGEPLDNSLKVPSSRRHRKSRGLESSFSGGSTSDENISDKETYSLLGVPKYFRRKSLEIPRLCIHCVHLEALQSQDMSPANSPAPVNMSLYRGESGESTYHGYLSDSENEDDDEDDDENDGVSEDEGLSSGMVLTPQSQNNSSRSSSMCYTSGSSFKWDSADIQLSVEEFDSSFESRSPRDTRSTTSPATNTFVYPNRTKAISDCDDGEYVETLQVPTNKQRSTSLDATCFGKKLDHDDSMDMHRLAVELPKHRSSSVDVNLPTAESSSYVAITHGDTP